MTATSFDEHAKPLYAATNAGVRPGMTADDVIGDGAKTKHYLAAFEHATGLKKIASIRNAMTDVLDFAPLRHWCQCPDHGRWATPHHGVRRDRMPDESHTQQDGQPMV